ncbi:MAG: hypothetical protein KF764_23610 [Labilithrix sp.]|nr:hypothetical protein [Labilithrix sp.]MBX3208054.1 hypothetical protein [Labilithrix sp.]MBX3222894.1 hypothetical protein [Labilithrix sp.]
MNNPAICRLIRRSTQELPPAIIGVMRDHHDPRPSEDGRSRDNPKLRILVESKMHHLRSLPGYSCDKQTILPPTTLGRHSSKSRDE